MKYCRLYKYILLLIVSILACSCAGSAINRTENYEYAWPVVNYTSKQSIIIGVIDQRPYVLSDRVDPTYVGIMRGGFGNPWYMHTESGRALAEDLARAITSGFKNAGINAVSISPDSYTDKQALKAKLISAKESRKLLLTLLEWKSDSYTTTTFLYDITAEVFDKDGNTLAILSDSNTGKSKADKSAVSSVDAGRAALTKVLCDQAVRSALQ